MIRMTTIERLPGRPRVVDGINVPRTAEKSLEIPDIIYDTMDAFCSCHGWRWEDQDVSVVRISENLQDKSIPAEKAKAVPLELPDDAEVKAGPPVDLPSLAKPRSDPFAPFKTDEDKWFYRGINTRPHLFRKRKAQGYEVVSDEARHGDLILGRIPRELKEARDQANIKKTKDKKRAVVDQFKEVADRHGIKTVQDERGR